MGSFDQLVCRYPLPTPKDKRFTFQTKDLDCRMADYVITEDGRLVQTGAGVFEDPPAAEAPVSFDGTLNFYHLEYLQFGPPERVGASGKLWSVPVTRLRDIEYLAHFVDDRVVRIETVRDEIQDNVTYLSVLRVSHDPGEREAKDA